MDMNELCRVEYLGVYKECVLHTPGRHMTEVMESEIQPRLTPTIAVSSASYSLAFAPSLKIDLQ